MKVRKATTGDLDVLVGMGERMLEESLISYPAVERDRVAYCLVQDEIAFFIAESDIPSGFMVCLIASPVFSTIRFAFHHAFYVVPKKRGSKAAFLLVRAYEKWALSNNARYTEISVDTGLFPERTGRFYQKMGYTFMGGKYIKEW